MHGRFSAGILNAFASANAVIDASRGVMAFERSNGFCWLDQSLSPFWGEWFDGFISEQNNNLLPVVSCNN